MDWPPDGSNHRGASPDLAAPVPSKPKPKPKPKVRRNMKRQRSATNINYDENDDEDDEPIAPTRNDKNHKAQKTTVSAKTETPRDYWEHMARFWERPDCDAISKLLANDNSYLNMSMPPLGRHYSERWEERGESAHKLQSASSELLKMPEGADTDLTQLSGYHDLRSMAMHHHTVAQRLMGAFIQLPASARKTVPVDHPPAPSHETVGHAQKMLAHGTSVNWNEVLCNELVYIGLLEEQDDTRLRMKDCEDSLNCQAFRAAQDSLRAVRKRSSECRTRVEMALNRDMVKIDNNKHREEANKQIEQRYMSNMRSKTRRGVKT